MNFLAVSLIASIIWVSDGDFSPGDFFINAMSLPPIIVIITSGFLLIAYLIVLVLWNFVARHSKDDVEAMWPLGNKLRGYLRMWLEPTSM